MEQNKTIVVDCKAIAIYTDLKKADYENKQACNKT